MKKYLLFIVFTSIAACGYSQEVKLSSKWSGQDLVVDAETSGYGSYSVSLEFSNLIGYRSSYDNNSPIVLRHRGRTNICKLIYESGVGGSPNYSI